MQLFASNIEFYNFRNYSDNTFLLDPKLTILLGKNAVGKTNAIEALQLLTSGDSFRSPLTEELVKLNEEQSSISLAITNKKRNIETKLVITDNKKQFYLNGKKTNTRGIRGILPSILFNPDDLQIIKGAPGLRRKSLDNFGIQLHKYYSQVKNEFEKALAQRNKILKDDYIDLNLLEAWTDSLITHATMFYLYRTSLFDRLYPYIKEIYKVLAPEEVLDISYIPSFTSRPKQEDKSSVYKALYDNYKEVKDQELQRKVSLFGPQKDDICFYINQKNARTYGSQGQQRSIVLAIKMAEVKLVQEMLSMSPLLLLDDVMSELDSDRRDALLNFIDNSVQTVISTTHLSYFNEETLSKAQVITLEK